MIRSHSTAFASEENPQVADSRRPFVSTRSAFTPVRGQNESLAANSAGVPAIPVPMMHQVPVPATIFFSPVIIPAALLPSHQPIVALRSPVLDASDKAMIEACGAELRAAIDKKDVTSVEKILAHPAADEIAMTVGGHGMNALYHAVKSNNLEFAKRLLKLASRNEQAMQATSCGALPIWAAARLKAEALIVLLLELSSAREQLAQCETTGVHPIIMAAEIGSLEVVKAMMASPHVNVVDVKNKMGQNLLHTAVLHGQLPVVDFFLKQTCGRDLALATDNEGANPLHLAAFNGNVSVMRCLLESRFSCAVVKGRNKKRLNALHVAAQCGHTYVVKYLLESHYGDFLVNQKAVNGNALHLAAQRGHLAVIELLLDSVYGETLAKQRNADDKNAQDIAQKNGHLEVAAKLKASGWF